MFLVAALFVYRKPSVCVSVCRQAVQRGQFGARAALRDVQRTQRQTAAARQPLEPPARHPVRHVSDGVLDQSQPRRQNAHPAPDRGKGNALHCSECTPRPLQGKVGYSDKVTRR